MSKTTATTYALTGIKTFRGREGQGLDANLTRDGKRIATVLDDANGGEMDIHFVNREEEAAFGEFAVKWYEESGARNTFEKALEEVGSATKYEPRAHDAMAGWIDTYVDRVQNEKRFNRLAKTKTIFRLKGETDEEWRTIKAPYSPRVQEFLDQKFPGKVAAIWGVTQTSLSVQ